MYFVLTAPCFPSEDFMDQLKLETNAKKSWEPPLKAVYWNGAYKGISTVVPQIDLRSA